MPEKLRRKPGRHLAAAVAFGLGLLALSGSAFAQGQLYRWVDAQGRVHYGDHPPAQAQAPVTRVPLQPASPTASRPPARKAAPLADGALQPPAAPASATAPTEADADLPPRGSPEDCRRWRIEYENSQGCYNRFRTAGGGIKAEAVEVCGPEVLDPVQECGPPKTP